MTATVHRDELNMTSDYVPPRTAPEQPLTRLLERQGSASPGSGVRRLLRPRRPPASRRVSAGGPGVDSAMYQLLVSFTVQPDHRDDFVRAARKVARDSLANEPGSRRLEVIADEKNPDLFYLDEVYTDAKAFNTHAEGPYFGAFFGEVSGYAEGPTWLMRGNVAGEEAAAG
ncbi:putative quinol monooxygenase [Plantactinospora endophytica]|uniref:ABM domain-containing protein n=1 Tax=Plantactinospora endophytica TaxID=673535 RepID=A0ABQ4EA99_9ACTN|nr:putative quinol monooxygenase [Plantactinospora endophytica]GIG91618.1 hypothetical protein Pen02_65540 [Plantactinospora endophytica]